MLTPAAPTKANYCVKADLPSTKWSFAVPKETCGGTYDAYQYGLGSPNTYVSRTPSAQLISNYLGRDVVYVLGSDDVCNTDFDSSCEDNSLDTSCEGLLLGWCRFARGIAFYQYLQGFATAGKVVHALTTDCPIAHDGCGMWTCSHAQALMWGDWLPALNATAALRIGTN